MSSSSLNAHLSKKTSIAGLKLWVLICLCVVCLSVCFFVFYQHGSHATGNIEEDQTDSPFPRYLELATSRFSSENVVGEGGYGIVYKGTLINGTEVAVKKLLNNLLPKKFSEGTRVFVVDPMLATGGTIIAAIDLIKERGVENQHIEVIAVPCAPGGRKFTHNLTPPSGVILYFLHDYITPNLLRPEGNCFGSTS